MEHNVKASGKIRIGLLVPLSGKDAYIGQSIIKSIKLAINKIDNKKIEILPKDTKNNPTTTLQAAKYFNEQGVKIVIGPIFNKNLIYLDELKDMTFVSFTNKTSKIPKNIISAGINSTSQLNAIAKFQKLKNLKKTLFLLPKSHYESEIKTAIRKTKIKIKKLHIYDSDPTKLTKQIEKITNYKARQLDLKREIDELIISDDPNKDIKIEKLKKKDTLGKVNFDSVIIADFDESLKSITTSLLYVDVNPKENFFITLNQWFDLSLLKEKNSQPLYFPSIDYENYKNYQERKH
jgi:outer membrane PBP1 activator LpoA protein